MKLPSLLLVALSIGLLPLPTAAATADAKATAKTSKSHAVAKKPASVAKPKAVTAAKKPPTKVAKAPTGKAVASKAPTGKAVTNKAPTRKVASAKPAKKTVSKKTASQKPAPRKTQSKRAQTRLAKANVKRPIAKAPARKRAAGGPAGLLALESNSVLVIDRQTGQTVYQKNPQIQTPIASITKLMTAIVTLDAGMPLNQQITLSREDVDTLKGTHSRVPLGNAFSRNELLHMALIASENRAAAALSRSYPGGRPAFVQAMNRKARALGMVNTRFVDGTGLSSSNQATAADLAKLVSAASRYPLISEITTTGKYDVQLDDGAHSVAFTNTNSLTRNAAWSIAISKTGYIREAGHCLVMQANVGRQSLIFVLLDSQGKYSRIGDANRIKKWLESGAAHLAKGAQGPSDA